MQEPSVRTSRLAIAGGLMAVTVVGGAGFFLGRSTAPKPPAVAPAPVATSVPAPVSNESVDPSPVLDRAALVSLAQSAADAFAAARPMPASIEEAAGRRFALVLPFGCAGADAGADTATASWRYDAEKQTLRISVAPIEWLGRDWALDETAGEAVAEGFWVTRPWLVSETCPQRSPHPVPTGTEPVTLPGQTLAVAQFFTDEASRDARRKGRAFDIVKRVPMDQFDASRGFKLRIVGRIDRVPRRGPLSCIQPAGIDQRPICVIATRIDEVAIENSATQEILGTWPLG